MNNCVNCHTDNYIEVRGSNYKMAKAYWVIVCSECLLYGRQQTSKRAAIEAWNSGLFNLLTVNRST